CGPATARPLQKNPNKSRELWMQRILLRAARTCLAFLAVAAALPAAAVVSTIQASGSFPYRPSLQVNALGNPVVAYCDGPAQNRKLATWPANCGLAPATWQVVTVDSGGVIGLYPSMQMINGRPVIAYYDNTNRRPKMATCTANCESATPTWQIVFVEA